MCKERVWCCSQCSADQGCRRRGAKNRHLPTFDQIFVYRRISCVAVCVAGGVCEAGVAGVAGVACVAGVAGVFVAVVCVAGVCCCVCV